MKIIKLLIYLKKQFPSLWVFVEFMNGLVFKYLFYKKMIKNADVILKQYENEIYNYRFLIQSEIPRLHDFFNKQNQEQFSYFKPHDFDNSSLHRLFNNPSFLLFGVFDKDEIIGYFFLRCFINKQCFTGRIVDERYQGQGIAKKMGKILHHIAWSSNFRVFGTASNENIKSLKSYQAINNYRIIKELDNNYIYFEYLKSEEKPL